MQLRFTTIVVGLLGIVLLEGCKERAAEPIANTLGSVLFRIKEQNSAPTAKGETRTWLATYEAGGKTARFYIQLTLKSPQGATPIAFTSGAFARDPQSDSAVLIRDLAKALEAKSTPVAARKSGQLPFQAAILGENAVRGADGGFSAGGNGTWIPTKVFVRDGEGEFFLNLDPVGGMGEISIKDSEYGDIVMKELAMVL